MPNNLEPVFAGNMTLVFSTAVVGDFVQDFRLAQAARLTPIAERQNFWCPDVLLDGRYPAQIFRHEFKVYREEASRGEFVQFGYDLEDLIMSDVATLTLVSSVASVTGFSEISYGGCYLEDFRQEDPTDLGLFRAGYFRLTFVGNVKPTRTP